MAEFYQYTKARK